MLYSQIVRLPKRYGLLALPVAALGAFIVFQGTPQTSGRTPVKKQAAKPAKSKSRVEIPAPVAPPPESPKPLANPPDIVKGVYLTSWSAGLKRRIDYVVDLHKTTGVNAVVIDIKDYSGYLAYRVGVPAASQYKAVRPTVRDIDGLVRRLHSEGIYAIARITCFQDPILARARPELAVHRKSKLGPGAGPREASSLWLDRKGLAWIDPASRPAWDYLAAIAKDAVAHGFDELNFDYVRFPSDGNLKDMYFPAWDGKTAKHAVIRSFFTYLQKQLAPTPISADLFGLATVNEDDLGIGQVIEDAYEHFDYVCPMVYPSHFARQFLGFASPAAHPYEVVNYSIQHAAARLEELESPPATPAVATGGNGKAHLAETAAGNGAADPPAPPPAPLKRKLAKIRPWLQDFNLGAKYDASMVKAQIKAVRDALGDRYAGYLIWAPSNVYNREALK